ncbi:MAG: 30S ribosome-binding factor RbfA [Clostridia bacterium]|nr:30S ribosome-binding factor RbfA [Clostridia bacterium]
MAGYRMDRINEDVMREMCSILRTLKDPRISSMLSVVRVEVTNDLSYATVYVSALEGLEAAKESVKGLKSASGYIRHELGSRLKLRHVPELRFIADNSIEKSAEIAGILNQINNKSTSGGEENEDN